MSKARILYLTDSDLSKPGGAQQSMKVLRQGLESNFDIYFISPKGVKLFPNHIILNKYENFILRGKNFFKILRMIKDIYSEIKKINPDIIHVQMTSTTIIINLLLKLKLIDNTKIVMTDRGVYSRYGKITKHSIDSLIPVAKKIITTTNVNLKNYKKNYSKFNNFRHKFEVIYNTAGFKFDSYCNEAKEEIRKELEISKNSKVIGFCGRYSIQKNWPLAKEIIEKIREKYENIIFILILGTDGSEKENTQAFNFISEIKNIVGNDKLRAYMNLENEKVSEVYYAFDYFVLTSKWESFGRTAVEAMARKNVVLGTNVDGLSEVIGDKKYLYSTSEEAVNKLELILSDPKLELQVKEFFYNRYHEKFSYRKNVESYKKIYEELLGK